MQAREKGAEQEGTKSGNGSADLPPHSAQGRVKEFLTPPLLLPDGHPTKTWAKEMIKHKTEDWGKTMLNAGHWSQGLFEWAGDDNATAKDLPKAFLKGVWF